MYRHAPQHLDHRAAAKRSLLRSTGIFAVALAVIVGGIVPAAALSEKDLPKITVKETVIDINPQLQFSLPNGAVDLNLGKQYQKTSFGFSSKYDLVDNFLGFGLNLSCAVDRAIFGVQFYDNVDFSEFYAADEYLQRRQSVGPLFKYALGNDTQLNSTLNFEKTFTNSVKTLTLIEQGRDVWSDLGVEWNTQKKDQDFPTGGRSMLRFVRSMSVLGSDYEYAKAEYSFQSYYYTLPRHFVTCELQAGYPLFTAKKPLTEAYTGGGYNVLRGYDFKEFRGDAFMYASVSYTVPLAVIGQKPIFLLASRLVTFDMFSDICKIGDAAIYTTPGNVKASLGAGVNYHVIFLKNFPLKLGVSIAKAFENRPAYLYFSITTAYYTWRS